MTGPLAADRPTEGEVRALVTKLLTALGDTEKAVAATLLAGGHFGDMCKCADCPVANYLDAKLRAAGMNPHVVKVIPTHVQVGWYGIAPGEDDLHVYVPLTRPVALFVTCFDHGSYPELSRSAAGGES